MPILDVEVVGPLRKAFAQGLAARLADAVGQVLDAPPMTAWVRVRRTPRSDYAESGGGPPPGVLPVFVTVLVRRPPRGRALARAVAGLTRAVAAVCGRPPANVHVAYDPGAGGRVAFGGRVVPR